MDGLSYQQVKENTKVTYLYGTNVMLFVYFLCHEDIYQKRAFVVQKRRVSALLSPRPPYPMAHRNLPLLRRRDCSSLWWVRSALVMIARQERDNTRRTPNSRNRDKGHLSEGPCSGASCRSRPTWGSPGSAGGPSGKWRISDERRRDGEQTQTHERWMLGLLQVYSKNQHSFISWFT